MPPAFRKSDEKLFLASEPSWKSRLGAGWKGVKFLGKGGNGVVGLWEYQSTPEASPEITKVVVKMSEIATGLTSPNEVFTKTPLDEGNTLEKLALYRSDHIIRQYGGNKIGDVFEHMEGVVRVFLEYCPSGDCGHFLGDFEGEPKSPLAEVDLWALFHCMALGLTALDRGTEDISAPAWDGYEKNTELVHFDIKPDNIFLGYRDDNHQRMPIAKIGDFGEAYEVREPRLQNDHYGGMHCGRGMEYFHPPEETIALEDSPFHVRRFPLENPRKGTCSNIWQVGTVMNQLMVRKQLKFSDENAARQCTTSSVPSRGNVLRTYLNHSIDLETGETRRLYSQALIALVMECLVRPSLKRPSSRELVQRTGDGLKVSRKAMNHLPGASALPSGFEHIPRIQSGWPQMPTAWGTEKKPVKPDLWKTSLTPPSFSMPIAKSLNNLASSLTRTTSFGYGDLAASSLWTTYTGVPSLHIPTSIMRGIPSALSGLSNYELRRPSKPAPSALPSNTVTSSETELIEEAFDLVDREEFVDVEMGDANSTNPKPNPNDIKQTIRPRARAPTESWSVVPSNPVRRGSQRMPWTPPPPPTRRN